MTLRRLKSESGRSLRDIERTTRISNSSLSRYLSGQATPSWNVVVALCRVTGHDPRPLRPLWEAADRGRRAPGRPFDAEKPPARPAPRNDLPRDVAAFAARRDEVDALVRLARAGHTVAIDGMGGIGKTALAVHVAHLMTSEFPDCQLYVDLHGFTPGREPVPAPEALLALLRALGVPAGRIPDGLEERAALWRSELAGRRALVVLDNAADADHVRALLPGAGRNTALVTSRNRMVGLDGVEPLSLTPLNASDAAELFRSALGPGTAADPETVAELMRRYGGLPLAIRVAAARLRHRPSWSIADLLDNPAPTDEAGLDKVIDASLARLSGEQRRMFRLLGVFPGTVVGLHAAAALADLDASEARVLLDDLVDANLLEEPGAQRYRFHDLIRERAGQIARCETAAGERNAALDRLTAFYLHCVKAGREVLEPTFERLPPLGYMAKDVPKLDTVARIMAWFDTEAATVLRIVELTAERGQDEATVQFALVIGAFLGRRGEMDPWYRIAAAGVRAAERRADPKELAKVRYFQGVANRFAGRLADAEADFAAVLAIGAELADVSLRLQGLWRLAGIAEDRGDFVRVLELRDAARAVPETDRYSEQLAFARLGGGYALVRMGRAADAAEAAQAVLAMPEADEPMLRITALRLLGHARLVQDDAEAALETFHAMAAVARATGHEANAAAGRGDVAEALSRLGRHAEALDEGEAATTWSVDNGEPHHELYTREAFGRICLAAGDRDRAAHHFRRSLDIAEPRGYRWVAEQARRGLALAACDLPSTDDNPSSAVPT
ncbi:hypothetical protein GCM10009838_11880 [Catenulispora subtropica]|uniref:HTH cro/C1-type domain-containing protein n=1 Tax=Catenulispora subtropica TaxID=450798 RepID=A0ABN2QSV9_9ACTN